MTAVGDTAAEADRVYAETGERLRDEAKVALEPQWLA